MVEEIGYGVIGGVLAGIVAAYIVKLGVPRGLIEAHWLQVVPVAGAALAYGVAVWLGGSGFIAAFVGGMVFGGIRRDTGGEVIELTEEVGSLLGGVTFILFGAVMLAPMLNDLSAEAVAYAILSLTVVRMIPVALSMIGTGARRPTLAFVGWFGPRGLASIVFTVILIEDTDVDLSRRAGPGDRRHHRPLGPPARPDCVTAHRAVRALVRGISRHGGNGTRERPGSRGGMRLATA